MPSPPFGSLFHSSFGHGSVTHPAFSPSLPNQRNMHYVNIFPHTSSGLFRDWYLRQSANLFKDSIKTYVLALKASE